VSWKAKQIKLVGAADESPGCRGLLAIAGAGRVLGFSRGGALLELVAGFAWLAIEALGQQTVQPGRSNAEHPADDRRIHAREPEAQVVPSWAQGSRTPAPPAWIRHHRHVTTAVGWRSGACRCPKQGQPFLGEGTTRSAARAESRDRVTEIRAIDPQETSSALRAKPSSPAAGARARRSKRQWLLHQTHRVAWP